MWGQVIRHLRIPSPRFIGREDELLWLQERLEEARRGQGDIVFIAGEAGVGKSRLLTELVTRGQYAEIRVLEGRCSLFESALPYAPFIEAFRGLFHSRTPSEIHSLAGDYAGEVIRLLPELTQLIPGVRLNPPLSPPEERSRLFESLYQILRQVAAESPLILTIEDLHWADPASLELLHFLGRRLRRDRWLVLATYRPEELAQAETLKRVREELSRGRLAQELALGPLNAAETGELLRETLGALAPAGEALATWVYHSSEGNPFFTEEILRSLIETSDAHIHRLDQDALSAMAVPATIRDAILARMRPLGAEARGILAAAAVLGRSFDLAAVQTITGLAGETVTQPFMNLLSVQLVRADRIPLRYVFRHHLIRETVLESLPPDTRRSLHQRVGELLEGGPSPPPQILAYHFNRSGDRNRTVRYAMAAGSEAAAVHAHWDATQYYGIALEALAQEPSRLRLQATESLGDAWVALGDYTAALESYGEMRQLAEGLTLPGEVARAHRKIGAVEDDKAAGSGTLALRQGLRVLTGVDDAAEEATIWALLSNASWTMGQHRRGIDEGRAAVAAAERAGSPGPLGRAYRNLGSNLYAVGQTEEARDCHERALTLARRAEDLVGELAALNSRGRLAMERGDFAQARGDLEQARELIVRTGSGQEALNLVARCNLAHLLMLEGAWDESELAFNGLLTESRHRYEGHYPFTGVAIHLATIHLLRGRYDEARALLDEARTATDAQSSALIQTVASNRLAALELRRGSAQLAKVLLQRPIQVAEASGFSGVETADNLRLLSEACLHMGDLAEAGTWADKAAEVAACFPLLAPAVARTKGRIAAQFGTLDEAAEHQRAALEILRSTPQPYQEALVRHDLGVCLLRRSKPRDRAAARTELTRALTIFERLGATPDAEGTRQALQRIGGRAPTGGALTQREREVLTLVADGLSNAAIAARLFIAERTVEVHVSHIRSKLNLESRTQITAWAVQRGLTSN
jgi:DNA-binding CsgD family transcriptional regulator